MPFQKPNKRFFICIQRPLVESTTSYTRSHRFVRELPHVLLFSFFFRFETVKREFVFANMVYSTRRYRVTGVQNKNQRKNNDDLLRKTSETNSKRRIII